MAPTQKAAAKTPWARLQDLLTELKTGDTITTDSVAAATGLEIESVELVLCSLTRAGLFVRREGSTFVRETVYKPRPH